MINIDNLSEIMTDVESLQKKLSSELASLEKHFKGSNATLQEKEAYKDVMKLTSKLRYNNATTSDITKVISDLQKKINNPIKTA